MTKKSNKLFLKVQISLAGIGILIVLISHVVMLMRGLPADQFNAHVWLNLFAVLLIIIGSSRK